MINAYSQLNSMQNRFTFHQTTYTKINHLNLQFHETVYTV